MPKVETIKIVDENKDNKRGWKIINKEDFDSNKQKEYQDKPNRKTTAKK